MRLALLLFLLLAGCSATPAASVSRGGYSPVDDVPAAEAGAHRADAGAPATDASSGDASPIPDALIFTGPLPACSWPSTLTPDIPDGALPSVRASRTFLVCGPCITNPLGGCAFEAADSGMTTDINAIMNGDSTCAMGCRPDQYAVTSAIPSVPTPSFPGDAQVIDIPIPAGCTGTLPAVTYILDHMGFAEGRPGVSCCPCQ